jgi:nitroreductase
MNPELEWIFSRRSVRKYQDRGIPEAMIRDLLEAGMAAPSAVARDPWHFLVIQKKDILQQLADILPHGQMLRHAPAAFVVVGDINRAHGRLESYMLQDVSAAIENILLAANRLGLGCCWLGVHPRSDRMTGIRKLFDLPEHIIPVSAVALGWPAEHPEPRTRYKEDRVHLEKW